MRHVLSLHIPETMNDWSFTIHDTSIYATGMAITCPTLQVQMPGFTKATTINDESVPPLAAGFIRHLTACNLEVQTVDCGSKYNCLPDGVYAGIRQRQPRPRGERRNAAGPGRGGY